MYQTSYFNYLALYIAIQGNLKLLFKDYLVEILFSEAFQINIKLLFGNNNFIYSYGNPVT